MPEKLNKYPPMKAYGYDIRKERKKET